MHVVVCAAQERVGAVDDVAIATYLVTGSPGDPADERHVTTARVCESETFGSPGDVGTLPGTTAALGALGTEVPCALVAVTLTT